MAKKGTLEKVKIVPLADRVLVKALSAEEMNEKSVSGIILPETLDKERPEQGRVIEVGKGKVNDHGEIIPMTVKAGDRVLFAKYGPDEITVHGENYLIMNESSILAIVAE
ncbi:MAG TPA: co-chaperone GroES [Candidatus Paceibacterota bacterium]|nr:co-chaperone GroES [Candidatus Paceibacterota bacterium]